MRDVAAQEARHDLEHPWGPGRGEDRPWIAVEGALCRPRRGSVPVERRRQRRRVALEVAGDDRIRGEPGGDERLVHAVAGQRVDEPCRVADEERPPAAGGSAEPPHRQAMTPDLGQRVGGHAVGSGKAREVLAESRSLTAPSADTEVRAIPLGEDPAVPAG